MMMTTGTSPSEQVSARRCGLLSNLLSRFWATAPERVIPRRRSMRMESLEPRVLLSADFMPAAAAAMADGIDQLGVRMDEFLSSDATFGQRVPLLLKVTVGDNDTLVNEAPTVGDLSTVPVDANGDGSINGLVFSPSDDDEPALDDLDADHDGRVDAGEFLAGWFFEPVRDFLDSVGPGDTTTDFENFLKGSFFSNLNQHLDQLGDYVVDFKIIDAKVHDNTENPDAEVTFSVGFQLTVSHAMPIDLGLEGDAIKLLAFTGSSSDPQPVNVPVDTTLSFGFDFGVFTGGKTPSEIGNDDFFVRKADPLLTSVVAKDSDLDFKLNIGFLGAQVVDGKFDLQADIQTTLLDPNDPAVFGFTDGQRGVESTSGVVTAANSLPSADLMHDAGFFLRIGNVGITTPVFVADADAPDNATLKSQIDAALASAGLDEVITADITGGKVQFALVPTSDTPLGFANETLSLGGVIDTTPDGDGPNAFEYLGDQVFLLSVGGQRARVVTVHFPNAAHEELGFGASQDASLPGSEDQVVAVNAPSVFDITADANFTVTITLNDGTQHVESFTVTADDTDDSADAGELALAIDQQLVDDTAFVWQYVQVLAEGGKIKFEGIDSNVSAIRVQASGTATSEIGFASDARATLSLTGSGNAIGSGDLGASATFTLHVTTVGSGTATKYITVAPDATNGTVADLANDVDSALAAAGVAIDAFERGGKIVLQAQNENVAAFDIQVQNENIDDLVHDVQAALDDAGLGGDVTASNAGGKLRLDAGGESIEISKTLTFDAGVTHHELAVTPTDELFSPVVGGASHATLDLPVKVLAGLEDLTTVADDDWNPQHVALVANFSPLGSSVAEYDAQAKRFSLHFSYDPTITNQDSPVGSVPASSALSEEIRLVNMAEPLNFNLLGAENMVGLLMGVGTALQQIADSNLFAGYDIPFTKATLSDLLNFTDADKARFSGLLDLLVFDTGGDGIDGSSADTDKLLKKISVDGDSFLIPAFVTAQELAERLHTILGVALSGAGGINAAYDILSNELTYRVDLIAGERTKISFDTPFQYDVSLSPFAKMTVDAAAAPADTKVALEGRTGLAMTFGVDLSPPGAVIFPDTPLAELNGGSGVEIKKVRAITGTVDVPVAAPDEDPLYQLAGNATFSISVNGAAAVDVTVLKSSTLNRSMGDLAADVNNSLAAANLGTSIVAQFDDTRLVLAAKNPLTTFSIASANAFAQSGLGLSAGTSADQTDFVITASNGGTYAIALDTLSAGATVQDALDLINSITGSDVTADFNATHTGLRLVDHTAGSGQFRVDSLNASTALLGFGFFGAGNTGTHNQLGDGDAMLIEGGAIGVTHLDERFFVRDAEMRLDGIKFTTPAGGVPGEALFGIVGVDTTIDGSLIANMTAALKDPVSGSQVTLAELLAQTGAVANPVVSKAQELAYDGLLLGGFQAGDLITGNTSGATAVVTGVDGGTLTLAHVSGSFANDEFISSKELATVAQANGSQSVNDVFGDFTLGVDVQPGFDDVGFGSGFSALDGMSYVVPVQVTGFGDPFGPTVASATLDLSGIGDLAAFEHLSYSHLASALHGLEDVLAEVNSSFALFNTKLPAINRSVSELLHLVEDFSRSVGNADFVLDTATAALDPAALDLPALSLQGMAQALRGAFGLPSGVDPDDAGAVDFVRLDFDAANNLLLLDLSLNQVLSTKLGLDIDVGSGLPKLTSGGVLKVAGELDVELHTAIDLATPENAYLLDTSSISAALHVEGEGQKFAGGEDGAGMVFYASLGPLAVFIQDADATIDVAFSLPGLDFGGTDRKLIGDVVFDDFDAAVITENNIDIVLPMFYGGEGPDAFIGEFSAAGAIDSVAVTTPDFSSIAGDIQTGALAFDPFDNISLAIDTINIYLESLTDAISSRILNLKLPFIGDQMADVLFIEEFREALVGALKSGIENAINPDAQTIVQGLLAEVFGTGGALSGYLESPIVATDNVGDIGVDVTDWYRQWNFTVGRTETLVIDDFDFGIPNLDFDVHTPVQVQFEWSVDLGFGVNFGESAYIDVADAEDIDLHLTVTLPGGTHDGTYGFLPVKVTDPGSDTGARLNFDIDVQNGADASAEHLAFSDLGSVIAVATLQGEHLASEPHSTSLHLVTQAMPGLPEMHADLIADWSLISTEVESLNGDAVAPGIHKLALEHIELDAGSIAEQLLGPLFDKVAGFIDPFMPVVDTLTAPIPILSDLAGEPFTLLDLAGIFGEVDPRFIDAVADILDVISSINDFINAPVLKLADLVLYDDAAGISNFDPNDPGSKLSNINIDTLVSGLTLDPSFDTTIDDNSFLSAVRDHALAEDLSVPILEKQREGIKLFLDQNATLLQYELPPLEVNFDYLQVFPVFGPLAVSIEISFGFGVDLHAVGFDTYGYKRYAEGGFRNPGLVFDGFFFKDSDETGTDAPEVKFEFGLVGAAELNLGIARAGVGGGIDATITFDWHDAIADDHVHLSEIAGAIAAEGNPLAAFDVGGALTFELFAFIEFLTFRQDIPITPKATLFSFEDTSKRAPILASVNDDGTLYLNMGPNAKDRLNGDTSDGNEEFSLEYSGGDVLVWSDKLGVNHASAQKFSGVKHIIGLGGQGNDVITLDKFDGSNITAEFDGGVGDDRIEYLNSTGSASVAGARIIGGLGNDTLTGGDANDVIYGGEGNDIIKGGGGFDILFGDQGRLADTLSPPFISSRITSSDGDDTIEGGAGDDVIFGGGGSDTLKGDGGNDIIIGDGGRFEYMTTGGHVDVASLRPAAYVPTPVTTPVDPQVISDQIDAIYNAMTGTFQATDLGFGGNDKIFGGADNDMILGGSGDDVVQGEGGDDIILGGKGFDDLHGGDNADSIFGGDQADTIAGDAGADVISGGAGNDFIHGNAGNDVMKGDSGADVMFGDADDDQVFGQTEPDILFGGIGNDLVVGGTGNDIMFGDDGLVAKIDPADGSTAKAIGIGNPALATGAFYDNDIRTTDLIVTDIVAGDGNDIMSGDAGDDLMLGGGGNDLMGGDVDPRLISAGSPTETSEDVLIGDGGKIVLDQRHFRSIETVIGTATGAPFDDTIYGDNGNDYIFGGRGSDFLFGGHGKVVSGGVVGASRGATDVAASDNDIIVGDNGEMLFAGASPVADNFGVLSRVRTTDLSNATGGHEYAEGELGADVIFGGVNASVDVLFGNAGNDVILGDDGELDFDFDGTHDLSTLDLIRSYLDGLGGTDEISGSAGDDVLVGGTGGDQMYGDDAAVSSGASDGEDIMLGDNGDIFLIGTIGRLKVQVATMSAGTAVDRIMTTDNVISGEGKGGADTMSGNARADIMLGGVNNAGIDTMYGDRALPTGTTIANDANDIMLGDNGELDFTFGADTSRDTLDLIRSYEDGMGGTDVMSGNKGLDVVIGGSAGDVIYGDDAAASAAAYDLGDLLLGDNADVFLVAQGGATGPDLKVVLGAAVMTIRTTDEEHPEYGGSDTISGNAKGDIIAGGVKGDTLYGDRAAPNATTSINDGGDIILGDNGAFEWLSTGRLSEIQGIDIAANNAALYAKYGTAVADTNLGTLDLITTEQPTSGGRDTIYGDEGSDLAFGGTDLDLIHGDDGNEIAAVNGSANADVLFGDHGRLYPQFSTLANFNSRNFFAIDIGDGKGGEGDVMWGEEGDDVMLGQQGDDRMWGGSGNDDMIGGHNMSGGVDEIVLPAVQATNGLVQYNDLMDGGSGNDAMKGDNVIVWRRGDDLSPRFRLLTSPAIYTTTETTITANVGASAQSDPDNAVGRDITVLDHSDAVQSNPLGRFGDDLMAGGAGNDLMLGDLGNDVMQGDGSISAVADTGPNTIASTISDSGLPNTGGTLYFNVPEAQTDGDDYMEGSGGNDLMYGGLGQDDMIGGSSDLFGLDSEDKRPDGSDVMFGGAGIDISRNNIGDATEDATTHVITTLNQGHARDADFMMGDNARVFRLVDLTDHFLGFNYDTYDGGLRLIPRAMQQLDYTLGGGDFAGGGYDAVSGQATPTGKPADNGLADLIHGESGDDIIFGMTGSDVMFGEGQDDDLVGGYGDDWISGGTGQDGVLGDDGLIRTSRNSTSGESLYGVAGLLPAAQDDPKVSQGNVLDELIATPGTIQIATVNISGELKKTFDITPLSFDPQWHALDDEFPDNTTGTPFADDIIFGGLGSDWLHGGSGDDAISGAEALAHAYVPLYAADGITPVGTLDLGYLAVGIPSPQNPGDVLGFNSQDLDGRHLNNRFRAGEFRLYDEYDPLRQILLTPLGELDKSGTGRQFILNFNKDEGVVRPAGTVPKATGQQTESYPAVRDDGRDAIYGDLGNDWLVGGTGRDDLFGGWGNDLLNADDDQTTLGDAPKQGDPAVVGANDRPDTHPYYEDRAYGGAGRDVLIGNTGGDRLIDWVGEYNSFLVPYAPFGQASVSRTLMPHLHEFLYALSAADGADPTRFSDTGADPLRNGEPDAELGLVLQKDFAWGDQTGAPADPQAGNIPGGKRDVLRSAGFNDGTLSGFAVDKGSFTVQNSALQVTATSLGMDATAVLPTDEQLPTYYEVLSTITVDKPTSGWKGNSYIVFDYFDAQDFKYAGLDISNNKVVMGYHDASGWHSLKETPWQLKGATAYNVMVAVNGTSVALSIDNKSALSFNYAPRIIDGLPHGLNMGLVGLGSDNSRGTFDNFTVQRVPPAYTLQQTEQFTAGSGDLFDGFSSGTWKLLGGRYEGSAPSLSLVDLGIGRGIETSAIVELSAKLRTDGKGGFVFDRYADDDYKFVTIDAPGDKVIIGHVSPKGGLKIDASFTKTIDVGIDYTLVLTLKGTSASVSLAGQAVGGFVYNGVTVDGDFGLLSSLGKTSFDSFTLKTNDRAFAVPVAAPMVAATASSNTLDQPQLRQSDLDSILAAATETWANVLGAADPRLALLGNVHISMADFGGLVLGQTAGANILVDQDAAGYGWFVDVSPADSSEFRIRLDRNVLGALRQSDAFGRMDLLTVVTHEAGHVLGFEHAQAATYPVMLEQLDPGVRYLQDVRSEGNRTTPVSENNIALQAGAYGAWRKAVQNNLASFGLDNASASSGSAGRIDWTDRFSVGSATNPSPFGSAGSKSAQNFSDFMAKIAGSDDEREDFATVDRTFDKMGSAIHSSASVKAAKGAVR